MAKVTSAKTNVSQGEFAPRLLGRFDITAYSNAAKTIENFIIMNAGGVTRRPGGYYVAEVKDSDKSTRLIDFQFSTEQSYILELGEGYIRFITDKAQVDTTTHAITGASKANPCVITSVAHPFQDGDDVVITDVAGMTQLNTNTYEVDNRTADTYELKSTNSSAYGVYTSGGIATRAGVCEIPNPYSESELFDIQYAQSADVMYMVHPLHEVVKLQRLSATSWSLTEVAFERGPFLDDNVDATLTITPSADAGAGITLTAASAAFNANHVGSFWRIKGGVVKITAYTSTTVVTGDVQDEPDGTVGALGTGPAATEDWAEGAWSNDEGFPSCVTFHEQRLAFAATTNSPQTVWASESQSFESFNDTSTDDSDAYSYKIASEQVNRIRWLSSGPESLQIGTAGSTFSLSSGSAGVPITPSSVLVRRETTYGAANILPKRIGPYVYFIQRNLKVLREIGYSLDLDSQQALDMTILSNHVTGRTGIVDMAYQQAPHDMLWCIRKDGQMATLTRQIDHKVIGWARQISGEDSRGAGLYESVACVPVEEADDETWVIVKRYINGSSVRYIEYFKPEDFDADHDMFFVDSGLSLDSPLTITAATAADPVVVTATSHGFSDGDQVKIIDVVGMTELNNNIYLVSSKTDHTFELTDLSGNDIDGSEYTAYISGGEVRKMVTTISGLDHLEGETVAVSADGAARANNTVASGAITLSSKASVVHVGLPYLPILQGLPLTDGSPTGTGAGKIRRIFQAVVRFYRTIGGEFGDEDSQDVIKFLDMSVPLGQPSPLFTGIKDDLPVDASWNRSGEFYITQPQPLPMTILFVVLMSQENE